MSDLVSESENDNTNPDVDNSASVTTESHTIVCETELDDDFFVCRKCNKVFKDLSEYLEHKIRDENYKLSHTRSKVYKRMVIPQLVEKKKNVSKNNSLKDLNAESNEPPVRSGDQSKDVGDDQANSLVNSPSETTPKNPNNNKRGRKRKAENKVQELLPNLGKENSCHFCDKKFRRAATLRWHLKYDHKEKEDNSEDSDTSMDVLVRSEMDEDFVPTKEQNNEDLNDGDLAAESKNDKLQQGQSKVTVLSSVAAKKQEVKSETFQNEESGDRPYICDICGRGFKELPVYKAHAIVHSSERNYVCTVDGCPYGFKTKGCLVRHMRRHTGERPYECEKCGRSFAESGALNRHLKARRNCAQTPDTHYPRYKKKWSYHPNIEAVVDEAQRDVHIEDSESLDSNFLLPETTRDKVLIESGNTITVTSESHSGEEVKSQIIVSEDWPLNGEKNEGGNIIEVKGLSETTESSKNSVKEEFELTEKSVQIQELKSNADIEFFKDTTCHVCWKDFQQPEQLEMHLRTHLADQPTHCALCHFLAQNRDEMRQHILTMHDEYLNDIESAVFAMEQSNPSAEDTAQRKDERTALREALMAVKQLHILKASREKSASSVHPSTAGSVQCLICHRTFKGVNYMRQHMRMHTGDRPFKCPQCNSCFTSKDVMKKHMYVHMDQRDYKCGECGKMFKRLVHVQQHLKTHSQERSFRCNVCDKLFKTHNSLKVHLRTHTNVNPYRCQVCNRHFRERGSLQRHMRLHTGEKPYVCPHCNRGFAEQGTLSRHLKAKVPCSATRDNNLQLGPPNSTMLAQFSSMVADTQYILPSVDNEEIEGGNLIVLKAGDGESEEVIENIEVITDESALEEKKPENLNPNETDEQVTEESNTETLQVYDPSTGESLIISGDKSVMDMVKSQQVAIEFMNGGLNLDKLRDILMAAGDGQGIVSSVDSLMEVDERNIVINEEMVESENPVSDKNFKLEINENEIQEGEQDVDSGSKIITVVSSDDVTEI